MNDCFSGSYAQARERFLAAARAAGLPIESHLQPLRGIDGDTLAMDVVRDGPAGARALLIVSSACHGIEGYCGSGVQVHTLRNTAWRDAARAAGVAVLYIHALNPWGFSHGRRVTHENIDINRNFHDFSAPLPVNADYREIHDLLLPATWPPTAENQREIAAARERMGALAFQAAVSRGQYEYPQGLFFGGQAPSWSNTTLRGVLRAHGRQCEQLAWIDLHTGLGPSGVGERIFAGVNDANDLARTRAWWGPGVTSIYDGSSTSALLTGLMWMATADECPQARYTGIALEYGTLPFEQVTEALRGDHWLALHPEADAGLQQRIRQAIRDAFYTDTDAWRAQILQQADEALAQAVRGLQGA